MVQTRNQKKKGTRAEPLVQEPAPAPAPAPARQRELIPHVVDRANIRRKIANRPEFENFDMKMYQYKNANISVNKMKELVQQITKNLEAKGLEIKVGTTIKIPLGDKGTFGWKSGRITEGSAPIQVWSPNFGTDDKNADALADWYDDGNGLVQDFDIFVQAKPKADKAGRDEHNDCLYNALYSILKETLKAQWKYASTFKKALGIGRDDMVNCDSHINQVEKTLNIGIFIEGDVKRTPKITAKNNIHLLMTDNHFSAKKEKKHHEPTFSFVEKNPVFYNYDKQTKAFVFYDGKNKEEGPYEKFEHRFQDTFKSSEFLMKCKKKSDLKEKFEEFVFNADRLKELTNGRINMYKTFTCKNTALKIFYDLVQHVDEPDPIDDNEGDFILGCYRGGLLFHEKGKFKVSKGDVCSMYPSIMTSQLMMPYKKGEFKTINQDELMMMKNKKGEKHFKCGIYHAKVKPNKNSKTKLFLHREKDYFTHVDMQQALKLGFDINIIEDGKSNFLYYPNESMLTARNLFKHYVEFLFKLKQEHPELVYIKRILNILWGALCERRISSSHVLSDKIITLEPDEEVTKIKKKADDLFVIECEEIGARFLSGFARIGPFITAHGRKMIGNLALEHVKDYKSIKRIYTDCILTTEQLDITPKEKCELGEFGLEHELEWVEIKNAVKIIPL